MNQDDQRFVLMAAAAQAHYAKQQARHEARKAALLSQVSALSNSSQPMDPKLQAELERLIRAEAQMNAATRILGAQPGRYQSAEALEARIQQLSDLAQTPEKLEAVTNAYTGMFIRGKFSPKSLKSMYIPVPPPSSSSNGLFIMAAKRRSRTSHLR
jgi:hypothetical protein